MSKSVLVIETPRNCRECPIRSSIEYGKWCSNEEKYIDNYPNIPEWCPLVPLPSYKDLKKYTDKINGNMMLSYQFDQGYNSCLDEIRGEGNESM